MFGSVLFSNGMTSGYKAVPCRLGPTFWLPSLSAPRFNFWDYLKDEVEVQELPSLPASLENLKDKFRCWER
jgi:hypothetical protein